MIAIVGGGIGGLAAAIGLNRAGFQVTVFERSSGLPESGTGLGIWPSALRALDQLGVGDQARRAGRRQPNASICRPDGSVIVKLDVDRIERKLGEPVYLLSRPALLNVLYDAVPSGAVKFSTDVSDVDTLRRDCQLVIGADGIKSPVRQAVFGNSSALAYSGWTVWRGVAPMDLAAGSETWGRGKKFGITPQGPGLTNFYAVLHVPEGYRVPDDISEIKQQFGEWHAPIPELISRLDPADLLRHDLHYLSPPLASYVHENVALLGDAAHAMTPDLGQGACQAIIDAAGLASALSAAPDIQSGLSTYDSERRVKSQRVAAMATRVSKLTAMRQTGLRNTILKALMSFGPPA